MRILKPLPRKQDFVACSWQWLRSPEHNPITIDRMTQIGGPTLYAVRHAGACLSIDGQWQHEPMPSSRDDEWMRLFRFPTLKAAKAAIRQFVKHPHGRFGG